MDRTKKIVYTLLAVIPLAAVLFVLATIHWLLLLLGLVVLLVVLLVLQKRGIISIPQLKRGKEPEPEVTPLPPLDLSRKQVYMVLSEGDGLDAERILVNREHFTIGREPDNDWVVNSGRVSRHHLQIDYVPEENTCYATDCGSSNGTYLNGERLRKGERRKLSQGDSLMIDDRPFNVQYAHY